MKFEILNLKLKLKSNFGETSVKIVQISTIARSDLASIIIYRVLQFIFKAIRDFVVWFTSEIRDFHIDCILTGPKEPKNNKIIKNRLNLVLWRPIKVREAKLAYLRGGYNRSKMCITGRPFASTDLKLPRGFYLG